MHAALMQGEGTVDFFDKVNSFLKYSLKAPLTPEIEKEVAACIKEAEKLEGKVFFARSAVTRTGEKSFQTEWFEVSGNLVDASLSGIKTDGTKGDAKGLFFLFATLGLESEKLLKKWSLKGAGQAIVMDAVLSARVEALVDELNDKAILAAKNEGLTCGKRISPGYGDWKLSDQQKFFEAFDLQKRYGVFLSPAMMMTPNKTVTAIVPFFEKTE